MSDLSNINNNYFRIAIYHDVDALLPPETPLAIRMTKLFPTEKKFGCIFGWPVFQAKTNPDIANHIAESESKEGVADRWKIQGCVRLKGG